MVNQVANPLAFILTDSRSPRFLVRFRPTGVQTLLPGTWSRAPRSQKIEDTTLGVLGSCIAVLPLEVLTFVILRYSGRTQGTT